MLCNGVEADQLSGIQRPARCAVSGGYEEQRSATRRNCERRLLKSTDVSQQSAERPSYR